MERNHTYTRREVLKVAGATGAVVGLAGLTGGYLLGKRSTESGRDHEDEVNKYLPPGFTPMPLFTSTPTPEVVEELENMPTQTPMSTETPATPEPMTRRQFLSWGVNTHVSVEPAPQENLTMEAFKEDVTRMKELGAEWVRFNVWEWEVRYADRYKEAIDYAKETGLNVFLVTNVPGLSENGEDLQGDLSKTRAYYERLGETFGDGVDIWQIFNESDDHNYADYSKLEGYPDGYLQSFSAIVAEANRTIKEINPNAKTTVNVSMWVGADWGTTLSELDEEVGIFDAACNIQVGEAASRCDVIDHTSLDIYADTNEAAIEQLPDVVNFFYLRYGSEVIIAELGIPTGDGRFSEQDQGEYVSKAIVSLQKAEAQVHSVHLYEYRDEAMKAGTEASFGITDIRGRPKNGYDQIIKAANQPNNE